MYDSRKLAYYSKPRHEKIVSIIEDILLNLISYQDFKNTIGGVEYYFFEYHRDPEIEDFPEWYIITDEGVKILWFYSKILHDGKIHDISEIRDTLTIFLDHIKKQIMAYNAGTDVLMYVDRTQSLIKDNPRALIDGKYTYDSRKLAYTTDKIHEEIIRDIEYIKRTALPDISDQFCHCFEADSLADYYVMTQKGYDLLQDYWTNQETPDTTSTIYATDKAGNKLIAWTNFKSKLLEPESHIEQIKNNCIEGDNTMNNEAYKSLAATASVTTLTPSRIETIEPRCKELLDLWYKKSKTSIYIAANAKCGELLEKDPLTQKIVQSLQTIRVLWGTDHPGDDNERQKQYKEGPGYYFELWMKDYDFFVNTNKTNASFWTANFWTVNFFNRLTYTTVTEKLLKGLEKKSKQLLKDLENKRVEIFLQINAADTYEQEIQILKAYGVLDTNGIISPAPADEITISLTLEE